MILQEYAQDAQKISGHLANALGVERSKIIVGELKYNSIPFLFDGREVARIYGGNYSNGNVSRVYFKLPAHDAGKSSAIFSIEHIGDLKLSTAYLTYHVDKHPEFIEVVRDLRQKRIPKEEILFAAEPMVLPTMCGDGSLEGAMAYYLGTSPDNRLCVEVEPKDVKYVPEASEQPEQGHHCIHGEDAPLNPFEINPGNGKMISSVRISLIQNSDIGRKRLEELLEGLPVPADGLALSGYGYNDEYREVRLRTPSDPFINIVVAKPFIEKNWEDSVALARNLEKMFK